MPTTPSHAIPYPQGSDDATVPADMQALAERVDNRLSNIAPSQLAGITGGHILVANGSGVVTGVAMSGDVTISDSGVTAIGTGKVATSMLANLAATTAKIDDLAVTTGKLANQAVTTAKIADNQVTSDKVNLAHYQAPISTVTVYSETAIASLDLPAGTYLLIASWSGFTSPAAATYARLRWPASTVFNYQYITVQKYNFSLSAIAAHGPGNATYTVTTDVSTGYTTADANGTFAAVRIA